MACLFMLCQIENYNVDVVDTSKLERIILKFTACRLRIYEVDFYIWPAKNVFIYHLHRIYIYMYDEIRPIIKHISILNNFNLP